MQTIMTINKLKTIIVVISSTLLIQSDCGSRLYILELCAFEVELQH